MVYMNTLLSVTHVPYFPLYHHMMNAAPLAVSLNSRDCHHMSKAHTHLYHWSPGTIPGTSPDVSMVTWLQTSWSLGQRMTTSGTTLNVQWDRGDIGTMVLIHHIKDNHEYSRLSDMCNMWIVDIQYTITVIVYCIVYGRSCDMYTFHLSGPHQG